MFPKKSIIRNFFSCPWVNQYKSIVTRKVIWYTPRMTQSSIKVGITQYLCYLQCCILLTNKKKIILQIRERNNKISQVKLRKKYLINNILEWTFLRREKRSRYSRRGEVEDMLFVAWNNCGNKKEDNFELGVISNF